MDNGEISSFTTNTSGQSKVKETEIAVPEIDLRGKTLDEIHHLFTQRIQKGYLLHGSPHGGLQVLEPQHSVDTIKGDMTAVFASDQPTIPIARAIGGNNLSLWTRQFIFQIRDKKTPLTEGYIYELPRDSFTEHPKDPSEYYSEAPVTTTTKYRFDDTSISQSFRTEEELKHLIGPNGELVTQQIRPMDIQIALLAVRNLLNLSGDVSYIENTSQEESYFMRLMSVVQTIEPLLKKGMYLTDPSITKMRKELAHLYDINTYEVYNAYNPMIMSVYAAINPVLKNL